MESEALQKEFGRRVRRRRMALGLLQKDLAERAQIPQPHVSRIEQGEYVSVNLRVLRSLADALLTTIDYLLSRLDEAGEVPDLLCTAATA